MKTFILISLLFGLNIVFAGCDERDRQPGTRTTPSPSTAPNTARLSDLKVLYISGYADDDVARQGILNPGTNFLHKPFAPEVLARKVHETISALSST